MNFQQKLGYWISSQQAMLPYNIIAILQKKIALITARFINHVTNYHLLKEGAVQSEWGMELL